MPGKHRAVLSVELVPVGRIAKVNRMFGFVLDHVQAHLGLFANPHVGHLRSIAPEAVDKSKPGVLFRLASKFL